MPLNDAIDTMQRREAALGPLWNAGRRIVIPVILVLIGMLLSSTGLGTVWVFILVGFLVGPIIGLERYLTIRAQLAQQQQD